MVDGQIVVRQVTQLALSFDHRIVDGQLGSQLLSDLAAMLADPGLAVAWDSSLGRGPSCPNDRRHCGQIAYDQEQNHPSWRRTKCD